MQKDFHYYATYTAALLAGYSHEECMDICYSAQFVDLCTKTLLDELKGPGFAATTQLQLELMNARTDPIGLQDITRIWSSFHFLPKDLYAKPKRRFITKHYLNKYRLICGPNGELLAKTVELAKGRSLQAVGIAMHVLADTWAHANFAGTPSLVINNTNYHFYELIPEENGYREEPVSFKNNPVSGDDLETRYYTGSMYQANENSIMNLGHGRAGHLPDYSFMHFKYLPAWGDFEEIVKHNPTDYMNAYCQMVYAMRYIRGDIDTFCLNTYATETVRKYKDRITEILNKRQLDSCDDWKAFGEELSGEKIEDFDLGKYQYEYISASGEDKDRTFIGKFVLSAIEQKSMVTDAIFHSKNLLAGYSVNSLPKWMSGVKRLGGLK